MDEDLRKRLIRELQTTGFSLEMELARRITLRQDWRVFSSGNYSDRDKDVAREIDLLLTASRFESVETRDGESAEASVEFTLVAEVKHSQERPWMLFREFGHQTSAIYDTSRSLCAPHNFPGAWGVFWRALETGLLLKQQGWLAYGVRDCSTQMAARPDSTGNTKARKGNGMDLSYSAAISALKAADAYYTATNSAFERQRAGSPSSVHRCGLSYFRPVVLVRGTLVLASIDEGGEFDVTEVPYGSCRFAYRNANYSRGEYVVDFVTVDALDEYLDLQKASLDSVWTATRKTLHRGTLLPQAAPTASELIHRR